VRFYLGDCLDVLRGLDPHSISVIATPPPYNLGVRYGPYDDTLPRSRPIPGRQSTSRRRRAAMYGCRTPCIGSSRSRWIANPEP